MKNLIKLGKLSVLFISLSLTYYSCNKDEVYKAAKVQTGDITEITFNSARVAGSISDLGSGSDDHGHCWSKNPEPTTSDFKTSFGAPTTGAFASEMTSLEMGIEYFVRIYVIQGKEIVYGTVKSFTTISGIPKLTTSEVLIKTYKSVVSGGEVSIDIDEEVTARGVCWNIDGDPTLEDDFTSDSLGIGSFVSMLDNLEKNTKYYLRAYATSSYGTGYGNEVEFEIEIAPGEDMTDSRNGKVYKTAQIGSQLWMAENLNYGTVIHDSVDATDNAIDEMYYYNNSDSLGNIYGGLYLWDEMMQYTTTVSTQGVCPDGWHLSSDEEWMKMESFLGMADSTVIKTSWRGTDDEGDKLKEVGTEHWRSNPDGNNESGFTALPGGRYKEGVFEELGDLASYCISSSQSSAGAWYRGLIGTSGKIGRNHPYRDQGRSVRCIKD